MPKLRSPRSDATSIANLGSLWHVAAFAKLSFSRVSICVFGKRRSFGVNALAARA